MIARSRFTQPLPEVESLDWDGPVLAACDLDRLTVRCRKLRVPERAVITPLAVDWLVASGVDVERTHDNETASRWALALEKPSPLIATAVESLRREALALRQMAGPGLTPLCQWAKAIASGIVGGDYSGGVVFTSDPGLVCCVANKLPGIRAAAANDVFQAAKATLNLAANLLAVEMPGRTFYEVKSILAEFCRNDRSDCANAVRLTLADLERRVGQT
jgi:ribose 5-phosphate isomerase RpiB